MSKLSAGDTGDSLFDSPFMKLVSTRFSVRRYDPERDIGDSDILSILEAARLAPSASNRQPWRYIVVRERELRDRICSFGLGGVVPNRFAREAPVIIVLCIDISMNYVRAGEFIKGIPYAFIDAGISGEHLILRAWELGIGSCWIGWFNEKEIKKILSIPANLKVASLITLGYPLKDLRTSKVRIPGKKRKPLESIAFKDRYGNPFGLGNEEGGD